MTEHVCTSQAPDAGVSGDAIRATFVPDAEHSLSLPLQTTENFSFGAVTESSTGEPSASELNRQLTNPVSSIWSIANQFNNFELNNATGITIGISSPSCQ